jgi:hypothetical protein
MLETLKEEDYAALDGLIDRWSRATERNKDGRSPLASFGDTMTSFLHDKDWQGNLKRIQQWRRARPKSAGAAVAEAHYWKAYAWNVRGSEYAITVDPYAMKLFGERMKRAEKILADTKNFAAGNPLWYQTYLDIAIDTKRDDRFVEKLFNEASRRHPYYIPIYISMGNRWIPKPGRDLDRKKLAELADKVVALTSEADGSSNYARFLGELSYEQRPEVDLMREGVISWPRMKNAFEELLSRYPTPQNANMYAAFACRAGDRTTFLNVRPRVVNHVVPSMWPGNYSLDLCDRRFTQQS